MFVACADRTYVNSYSRRKFLAFVNVLEFQKQTGCTSPTRQTSIESTEVTVGRHRNCNVQFVECRSYERGSELYNFKVKLAT